MSFFRQLDSDAADDALAGQAVKCLVFLCTSMHEDDAAAGRLPPPLRLSGAKAAAAAAAEAGANGHAANGGSGAAEEASDDEVEDAAASGSEDEEDEGDAAAEEEQQAGGGAAEDAAGSESEEEAEEAAAAATAAEEAAASSLTLHGLVRRMVRLSDDKTYARQMQRGAALRFIAAVASRLGADRVGPYLPLLMRPLYRITEPGACGSPAAAAGGSLQLAV
jgi:U3 small nucleolar RNA-associated protein 20